MSWCRHMLLSWPSCTRLHRYDLDSTFSFLLLDARVLQVASEQAVCFKHRAVVMCRSFAMHCLEILQLYGHFASSYLHAGSHCHLLVLADLTH